MGVVMCHLNLQCASKYISLSHNKW